MPRRCCGRLPPLTEGPAPWIAPCDGLQVTQGFHAGHLAVDFVSSLEHRPVLRCPADGVVTFAGWDDRSELARHPEWNRGLYVAIDHQDGSSSRWCHLSQLLTPAAAWIARGAPMGVMGNTGYVIASGGGDGTHCHGGVVDAHSNPVDWLAWLG